MADQKPFGPHHHDLNGDNPRSEDKDYPPGKVATLDEMLEMAKIVAQEEAGAPDMGGLEVKHFKEDKTASDPCKHRCNCACHTDKAVLNHIMACCSQCSRCNFMIKFNAMQPHLEGCHKDEIK